MTWQVGPPPQNNSYGQGRTPSTGPAGNAAIGPPPTQAPFGGTNSNTAQYSYAGWSFSQPQGSQGPPPSQYSYGADSSNGPPNGFTYQTPTGYDHFSSDPPPSSNYTRC